MSERTRVEIATLGGGCYWCLDAAFKELRGVQAVASGYAGGHVANPTYHQVCTGTTGHAEVVQVSFDPDVISYHDLLMVFFGIHDPTTLNRQGADVGTQYRSVIFAHSDEQARTASEVIAELEAAQIFEAPILTEIAPLTQFFEAEGYHQNYFAENPRQPYCLAVVAPKLEKFRKRFHDQLAK